MKPEIEKILEELKRREPIYRQEYEFGQKPADHDWEARTGWLGNRLPSRNSRFEN